MNKSEHRVTKHHVREDELTALAEDGRIGLDAATPEVTRGKLVTGITPQNRHREQDWGDPVGNEAW